MSRRQNGSQGRSVLVALAVSLGALSGANTPAVAAGSPACTLGNGPAEFQRRLGPLLSGPSPLPPAPPPPPARASAVPAGGAALAAREALGDQFTMLWVNSTLQGWVVGVAPGPLDIEQARAAIVERLAAGFSADDLAYLTERLHVDPQPYRESELRATQAAVSADLAAAGIRNWGAGLGVCRLSDAVRVEVTLYQPAPPELVARVQALLAPHGDRVRLEVSSGGPPQPAIAPPTVPRLPSRAPPAAISVLRYVSMPNSKPCVRGSRMKLAVRRPSRSPVSMLSVRANGRLRTISGTRLKRPLVVQLTRRRTRVEVSVKLRDGTRGTRTTTLSRCATSMRSR